MVSTFVSWYAAVMGEDTIQASRFKATCLALLDDVAETGREVVITKYGKPVAKLVPIDEAIPTMGSVTLVAVDDDAYFTTGETWDAER